MTSVRRLGFLLQKRGEFYRAFGDALVAETHAAGFQPMQQPAGWGMIGVPLVSSAGISNTAWKLRKKELAKPIDFLKIGHHGTGRAVDPDGETAGVRVDSNRLRP